MAHNCFKQGCELEVQYVCQCLSSMTYCCEFHLQAHLKLPNRAHIFDSVLAEPSEFTKDIVLKFLSEQKYRKEKLKKIILAFTQSSENTQKNIKSRLSNLNAELEEISTIIEKISQVPENIPQHDTYIKEAIQQNGSEGYAEIRLFFQLGQLRNKKSEILNRANNNLEIEQDFRRTCELFKNHASNSQFNQAYQEYINEYQKFTSTYLFDEEANLYCYNTEKEKEKHILIPEASKYLSSSLVQLPNGELFITGFDESTQIAFILDRNYQIRNLPLGVPDKCFNAIYYNRSVYCFGKLSNHWNHRKFDLKKNRWIDLTPIRKPIYNHSCVVFNRNILIPRDFKNTILLYSTDIDSFSKIPYRFVRSQKTLISAEERLYLIETYNGWIYESEDEYNWKRIATPIIGGYPKQVYCSYNKGGIYISFLNGEFRNYFKFDLNQKALIEIAIYGDDLSLKKSGNKLEVIDCYDQTFILNPDHASFYIGKGYSLYHIGKNLQKLEKINEYIENDCENIQSYALSLNGIGKNLQELEKANEFIEDACKSIQSYALYLNGKGEILYDLGRYIEAIECYNEAIKNGFDGSSAYNNKGNALLELGNNVKAIKCFNKAINIRSDYPYNYWDKGKALMNLGKYIEAIECFSDFIKFKPDDDTGYNKKGEALYNLDRNLEAIEYYNEAIKFKCDEPIYYCNRGNALKKLGRQEEAILDFNKAEDLNKRINRLSK